MIRLEEINSNNWRVDLHVSKNQKNFVADQYKLLARAYAYRKVGSKALMIYNDDIPIGMALYYECEEYQAYDFNQLFIDERYQRKGYGLEAAKLILNKMKQDGKYQKVILCYIESNYAAKNLYEKCGFYLTGERDENEIVMEKILNI